ncbi:MAG: hypothetical protein JWM82_4291 [Myxococcales bacterium]|nr:hypothetical protein [Myxococcales bacterium]
MSNNEKTARRIGVALLTLTALACAKGKGETPSGDETANVTAAAPAANKAPATAASAATPAVNRVVPASNGTAPVTAPTTLVETPAALPSPAIMQAVTAVQGRLDGLASNVAGARVRFVDCNEAGSCTTRLEATTLTALRDLLQSVSGSQGAIDFTAREQLDGFTGRTFVADVTLGAATPRAVPTNENDLLGITP